MTSFVDAVVPRSIFAKEPRINFQLSLQNKRGECHQLIYSNEVRLHDGVNSARVHFNAFEMKPLKTKRRRKTIYHAVRQ